MMSSDSPAATQWGQLTSLNPDFANIHLKENPSVLDLDQDNISKGCQCQIYHEKESFFINYTGDNLTVSVEDQSVQEGEAFEIHSGNKVTLVFKKQEDIRVEYVFSSEAQKDTLK